MKQLNLYVLLVIPIFLIALASANLHGFNSLDSFSREMKEQALAQAQLESQLADIQVKLDNDGEVIKREYAHELLSTSQGTLRATQGLYNFFGNFSSEIELRPKRQDFYVIFLSLFNVALIFLVCRSSTKKISKS